MHETKGLAGMCMYSSKSQYEPPHEIPNNNVCVTSKGLDQLAHTRGLIRAFVSRLNFQTSKEAAQARLSLHLSKCHIVGNHMSLI